MAKKSQVPGIEVGEEKIVSLRGHRVMLDSDLAELYGVTTKRLNEQVKRNASRFPEDFMFRLKPHEIRELGSMRSQTATASRRNLRFPPYVFTEHGAVMLASVLDSDRAVEMSVAVVRAFVRMRTMLSANREQFRKLMELEAKVLQHDRALGDVFDAIRQLMEIPPPNPKKRRIGF